jgi:hypothetical protein
MSRKKPGYVRNFFQYLSETMKFYEIKKGVVTPITFILILSIFSLENFLSYYKLDIDLFSTDLKDMPERIVFMILFFLVYLFVNQINSLYMLFYIKDLKDEDYEPKECVKIYFRRFFSIAAINIIYSMLTFTIIPGIFFYFTYIFSSCLILDRTRSVPIAFNYSNKMVDGKKMNILMLVALFFIFSNLLKSIVSIDEEIALAALFILSFIQTITNLMYVRLISQVYVDLEYGMKIEEDVNDV